MRLIGTVVGIVCSAITAFPMGGQAPSSTIDPGMTREQVISRLGVPASERRSGTRVHLFYKNGCEKTCGMHDLVTLESDKVVDAIFRDHARVYTGKSSSPAPVQGRRAPRVKADTVSVPRAKESGSGTGSSIGAADGRSTPSRPADTATRRPPTP
ncbi:MAG: hypothetical protein NVS1B4_15870 [Gemmatimonadaceae bacterium]